MRQTPAALVLYAISGIASAQTWTISNFAGSNPAAPVNVPATSVSLSPPYAIALDSKGNVFFTTGYYGYYIMRLDAATGILTLVAGNGTSGFSGDDGLAINAQLNTPLGLAVDASGNLYIADSANARVRKVSNGVITTVAGTGALGFGGDGGPATSAQLYEPTGVAVDSAGNLFIADWGNQRIRKVSGGVITTVAGNGALGFSGDGGPATGAQLYNPNGVAVDSAGNLYIADSFNNRIRKVSNGTIATVAGGAPPTGTAPILGPGLPPYGGYGGDGGPATSAQLYDPTGVAVDSAGNIYIADSYNGRVREVSGGVIATVAGGGTSLSDGAANGAKLDPFSLALNSAGNLYIGDINSGRIRILSNGTITTVAGNAQPAGFYSGDGGPATNAQLSFPMGAVVDSAANLYFADSENSRVRKVSDGIIVTVAGNGTFGFSGDKGSATSAALNNPLGVALDTSGNLYIADHDNNRVRKVSTNGVITTVAGSGTQGFSGDGGLATAAQLNGPSGVAVDSSGNLYIADTDNDRVREVSNGAITTVAGNGVPGPSNGIPGGRPYGGFSGDGGPAIDAQMSSPTAVAVDRAGNFYISDYDNNRIRKVSNGIIATVAGNGPNGGISGFGGDGGPATSAQLNEPWGIATDSAGDLYIADAGNQRIRRVSSGVITTIAGDGMPAYSGDNGPAVNAGLNGPTGIAVDSLGIIYVSDTRNSRVRILTPGTSPTISLNGVVPVYSSVPIVQAGSWVSIYGTELATGTFLWNNDFPTSLGGTSVTIANEPAYLWAVSPTQINLQVPADIVANVATVTVTTSNGTGTSTVKFAQQAPSFSLLGDDKHVAAEIATPSGTGAYGGGTYDLLGPVDTFSFTTRPVKAGETLMLYGVGFGPTSPAVTSGMLFSGSAPTVDRILIYIGGVQAHITYSGIMQAGLYQIDVTVPGAPSGDQPLLAVVNGVQTPPGPVVTVQ
jgi:uncharacterized protein (TIGR03437 family)